MEDNIKKFEGFLDRMQGLLDNAKKQGHIIVRVEDLENSFPELKESEDEKMWKLIKKYAHYNISDMALEADHITREQLESWLEKQGEKKYIPKYKIGDYVKNTNYKGEPIYEIIYIDKECYICEYRGKERMGDKAVMHFSFDNPYLRLVQKSDDKVEPKFKIGDWITNGDYTWKIVEVKPLDYILQSQDGNIVDDTISHVDEQFHSFTIEDAKDGDVLASKNGDSILIFRNLDTDTSFSSYYNIEGRGELGWSNSRFIPATKEQRDALEKAMADAGYTFDFDKKELKKNDTLLDLLQKMPSCITVDGINYHFVMKKTIFYKAYYEGEGEESRDKIIFWMAGDPVDLLTAMLEKLKEKGLLE